jgi:hypothetical protein
MNFIKLHTSYQAVYIKAEDVVALSVGNNPGISRTRVYVKDIIFDVTETVEQILKMLGNDEEKLLS